MKKYLLTSCFSLATLLLPVSAYANYIEQTDKVLCAFLGDDTCSDLMEDTSIPMLYAKCLMLADQIQATEGLEKKHLQSSLKTELTILIEIFQYIPEKIKMEIAKLESKKAKRIAKKEVQEKELIEMKASGSIHSDEYFAVLSKISRLERKIEYTTEEIQENYDDIEKFSAPFNALIEHLNLLMVHTG